MEQQHVTYSCSCGTLSKKAELGEPVDERSVCPDCGDTAERVIEIEIQES